MEQLKGKKLAAFYISCVLIYNMFFIQFGFILGTFFYVQINKL